MSALRTTFLFVALVCLILVAAAAVLVLARVMGWPLAKVAVWVAVAAAAALLALAARPLWRWIASLRARASESQSTVGAVRLKELRERWSALLSQLKASKLGAAGRRGAVGALPWYLVLGEEGSGKTTALRSSESTVGMAGPPRPPGPGGCRLDWALLTGAVFLDAPGYYAFPRDEVDQAEWEGFLSALRRTGREAPVNGVVVAVAADALLRKGEEELRRDAAGVRGRLDELTRRLGIQFPVYVLVTKLDKIEGMARFFRCFPEELRQRALGVLREARKAPVSGFAAEVLGRLRDKLAELRLVLLGDAQYRESHRQALLFPEDVTALRKPLDLFLSGLFAEDPYREPPILRGVFFASGHQGGKAAAGFLARVGFPEEELQVPAEDKGFFLKELFGQVLVRDGGLAAPTARAISFQRLTQSIGLVAWLALCLILGLVLTFAFARNLSALRAVGREVPSRADLIGRPEVDLTAVNRLRLSVEKLQGHNQGWGFGRFLLPQSVRAERALRREFDQRFRSSVLSPQDRWFEADLSDVLRSGRPEEIAASIDFLVKRIQLLEAASSPGAAGDLAALARRAQPDYGVLLKEWERPGKADAFRPNYLAHLAWGGEDASLGQELATQNALLQKTITHEGVALDWLVEWANRQGDLRPVRVPDFWGAEAGARGDKAAETFVAPAYTPAGAARIRAFLDQIAGVAGQQPLYAKARERFEAKYHAAYFAQWEAFLRGFPRGDAAWVGRERRAEMATLLGGNSSPYVRLLTSAPEALKPAVELAGAGSDVPAWVALVFRYEALRQPEYQQALKGGQGVIGKLATQGGSFFGKLREKILGGAAESSSVVAADARALPYWLAFQDSLAKMSERVHSPQASYQSAKDTFAEADLGVGEPQQPTSRAYWSVAGLKKTMGTGQAGEDVFWQLLGHQVDQIWAELLSQAEVAMQKAWEADVLAGAAGLRGLERVDALQGPAGKVWEFQDKVASPLLLRSARRRPEPKVLYNRSVHFTGAFLELLARGKVGQQAIKGSTRVQVSALPTDANPEAVVKPHMTRLVLQCSSGNQELLNQNYPVSRTFNWSPEECSDVSLEIGVGNAVLKKWYNGYDGFARFLADFRSGRRAFRAGDFPEERALLAANRIETITVAYNFRGQEGVLGSAATAPAPIPDRIIP